MQWNNITRGFQCTDVVSTERPIPDCTGKDQALQWDGQQFGCRTIQSQLELLWEGGSEGFLVTHSDEGHKIQLSDKISSYKSLKIVRTIARGSDRWGYYSHEIPVSSIPTTRDADVEVGGDEGEGANGDDGIVRIWSPGNLKTRKAIWLENSGHINISTNVHQVWGIRDGNLTPTESIEVKCEKLAQRDPSINASYNSQHDICEVSVGYCPYSWEVARDSQNRRFFSLDSISCHSSGRIGSVPIARGRICGLSLPEPTSRARFRDEITCTQSINFVNIGSGLFTCSTTSSRSRKFDLWPASNQLGCVPRD